MTTTDFLDRYCEPVTAALTPQVAQAIVELRPDPKIVTRVEELGRKSNDGTLTEEERDEYRRYVDAGDLVSVLKAKARRVLSSPRKKSNSTMLSR